MQLTSQFDWYEIQIRHVLTPNAFWIVTLNLKVQICFLILNYEMIQMYMIFKSTHNILKFFKINLLNFKWSVQRVLTFVTASQVVGTASSIVDTASKVFAVASKIFATASQVFATKSHVFSMTKLLQQGKCLLVFTVCLLFRLEFIVAAITNIPKGCQMGQQAQCWP